MIISASRRTDVPAFYSEWFMKRIEAGHCEVPNPFNPTQVSRVSLQPEDVEVVVFWTRNAAPLLPRLKELEHRGCRTLFLYTVMNNPRALDPRCPSLEDALVTFKALSACIGPERVIWRYDPVVFSNATNAEFHMKAYETLAKQLQGYTSRSIMSVVDIYRKVRQRMTALSNSGIEWTECEGEAFVRLLRFMASVARESGMALSSCAQERDLTAHGISPGKCIDDSLMRKSFGSEASRKKDPSQRKACGCVVSKDIGMYDTCLYGCIYCYATTSFARAKENYRRHDPEAPSLIPRSSS
ncbi:MAG: hypothetical protein H6Q48_1891 [Deltaproteobacteria bacterium]|nr:hypothetical protein [Deltaproteobacteria bacterium]